MSGNWWLAPNWLEWVRQKGPSAGDSQARKAKCRLVIPSDSPEAEVTQREWLGEAGSHVGWWLVLSSQGSPPFSACHLTGCMPLGNYLNHFIFFLSF